MSSFRLLMLARILSGAGMENFRIRKMMEVFVLLLDQALSGPLPTYGGAAWYIHTTLRIC
jgi:hypothetical protein